MGGPEREEDEAQTLGASQPFATTAIGPADVRDTPNVKPGFAEPIEDEDDDDDDEPDPWIGRTLSNLYQLEERIGEGGMGTVYVARHVHLEKRFAVKVLNEAAIHKNNAVERLKQEAVAASSIDHENIVDVVNFDRTEDGAVYIVMELLKGESLAERLGRGPIDLHRALPITYQICRALHAAHERGIVHRDLKPENVFLTDKGERQLVKVLDFGISKIKSADAEQVRMTKTGQLVGTPLYMSPEQARGEGDVDRRVDVYAMGVILYEMVTGAPPFEGRNYFELLWKHGNEPPLPIGERNPNVFVPEAIEQVLLRSLSKRREDRYQTMLELEQALLSAAPDVPALAPLPSLPPERASAPAQSPRRTRPAATEAEVEVPRPKTATVELPTRRSGPWIAAGLGALAIAGAAVWAVASADPTTINLANEPPGGPAAPPAPVAPVEQPREPEPPAGVEPPPATPRRVSVQLASIPPGAQVRLGDRVLGRTPIVVPMEASGEAIGVTFTHEGYLDQTVSVVPSEDLRVPEVRLRRRRQAAQTDNGTSLPIKSVL